MITCVTTASSVRSFLYQVYQLGAEARGLLRSRQIADELKRVVRDLQVELSLFLSVWGAAKAFAVRPDTLMKDFLSNSTMQLAD